MTPSRWLKLLARPGCVLAPIASASVPGEMGVYAKGDRRRRPLARVTARQCEAAVQAGWVEQVGETLRITEAGAGTAGERAAQTRQDGVVLDADGGLRPVIFNPDEGAVAKWRGIVSAQACAAAEQFLADYVRSTLHQPVTRNWSPTAPRRGEARMRGPDEAAVSALAAKDRVFRTLDALGPQFARIIEAALIREESLAAMERRFGWAQRSGRTGIELAFGRLAQIYGYPAD